MNRSERDWAKPEEPESWTSVWDGFHDAEPLSLQSDRLKRTIEVTFSLGFPKPPFPHPKVVRVRFEQVTFALVFVWHNWPGPPPPLPPIGHDPEKWKAVGEEFRAKSRIETASLRDLDLWMREEAGLYVSDGQFASSPDRIWFNVTGVSEGSPASWELRIAAASVQLQAEDDTTLTLEKLLSIGQAGWAHFGRES